MTAAKLRDSTARIYKDVNLEIARVRDNGKGRIGPSKQLLLQEGFS